MFLLRCVLSTPVLIPLSLLLLLVLYASIGFKFLFYAPDVSEAIEEPFELFLLSSYYYRTSKSLGNNSIALVFTGDFEAARLLKSVTLVAWNNETNVVERAIIERVTPHNVCRWISIFATTPLLPNLERLAISTGNKLVEIPFREPVLQKHDVVTCIAPLFGNEQWQQALFAAHIYKRYGSHMHLYIRSMVSPVLELLKIYEKEGYLTIQPWLRTTLLTIDEVDFNPNINIEFRNQAGAQTDCLLQYKESASYIAFVDLDDVLIPRLARNYLDEFAHLFHSMPNVAYIHYMKENTKLELAIHASRFSLRAMLSTIQFESVSETGKMVANPLHVNHTWIHYPTYVADGMDRYVVPNHINAITHLKHMQLVADGTHIKVSRAPAFKPSTPNQVTDQPLLSTRDIDELQLDFERMARKPEIASIFPTLPKHFIYRKAIDQCFEDTYYKFHYSGQIGKLKCPGPDRCLFPRGIPCYNSAATFHSTTNSTRINIHFATEESFREENGCLP